MLVLSRERDQTITIGHDVEVTVLDIRGDKVRLGISAPRSVEVHRKECYERIHGNRPTHLRPEPPAAPPEPK